MLSINIIFYINFSDYFITIIPYRAMSKEHCWNGAIENKWHYYYY